jgi:hypothetical protein
MGTVYTQFSRQERHKIELTGFCDHLDGTPKRCFGRRKPTEAFSEEMMKLRERRMLQRSENLRVLLRQRLAFCIECKAGAGHGAGSCDAS